jgi:hypothetical protein
MLIKPETRQSLCSFGETGFPRAGVGTPQREEDGDLRLAARRPEQLDRATIEARQRSIPALAGFPLAIGIACLRCRSGSKPGCPSDPPQIVRRRHHDLWLGRQLARRRGPVLRGSGPPADVSTSTAASPTLKSDASRFEKSTVLPFSLRLTCAVATSLSGGHSDLVLRICLAALSRCLVSLPLPLACSLKTTRA